MSFLVYNGQVYPSGQAIIKAQNRSFRYGDGLFETIKVFKQHILLEAYHFERLFQGLHLLQINYARIRQPDLSNTILELCRLNNCSDNARVRLSFFRNEENNASYLLEAFSMDKELNKLNEQGWVIDLYPHARKACDAFANIKSANYLPYIMADLYAKEKGLDECVVLNTDNKLCDASKANLFLLSKNKAYTPALHQGCVSGVKRRFVIDELKKTIEVHQQEITVDMLLEADEVFLTNAINDLRWVKSFREKEYTNQFISSFYRKAFNYE